MTRASRFNREEVLLVLLVDLDDMVVEELGLGLGFGMERLK